MGVIFLGKGGNIHDARRAFGRVGRAGAQGCNIHSGGSLTFWKYITHRLLSTATAFVNRSSLLFQRKLCISYVSSFGHDWRIPIVTERLNLS